MLGLGFNQVVFLLHLIHAFFFKHSLNKAFAFSPLQRLVSEIKSLIRRSNTNKTTQNKLKIRQKARDGNVCKHRQIFVVSLDLKEQTTISLYLQATVANSVSEYKTFPGYIAGKYTRLKSSYIQLIPLSASCYLISPFNQFTFFTFRFTELHKYSQSLSGSHRNVKKTECDNTARLSKMFFSVYAPKIFPQEKRKVVY